MEPLHAFNRADRMADHARGCAPRHAEPLFWSAGHIVQLGETSPSRNGGFFRTSTTIRLERSVASLKLSNKPAASVQWHSFFVFFSHP